MKDRGMYEGPVYHLFVGADMVEVKVCNSYPEYLAYYAELKKQGKGTRYGAIQLDRKARIYHYYLRVVDET